MKKYFLPIALLLLLAGSASYAWMGAGQMAGSVPVGVCSTDTDEALYSQDTGTDEVNSISATVYVSQKFTLASSSTLTGYNAYVQRTGFGEGSKFAEIWTDSSGQPGVVVADSRALRTYASLSDTMTKEFFELSSTKALAVGTYHVVIGWTTTGTSPASRTLANNADPDGGVSFYSTDSGSSWYAGDRDLRIEVLGCVD